MVSENDRIRHRITDMYAHFVQQVDSKGYVMDYLIQKRIVDDEVSQQLLAKDTKQERCRAMLHELLSSGKTRAFVVLREALEHSYHHIVERIDKEIPGTTVLSHTYIMHVHVSRVIRTALLAKSFSVSHLLPD